MTRCGRGDLEGELGTTLLLHDDSERGRRARASRRPGPRAGIRREQLSHGALRGDRGRCARRAPPRRRSASTSFRVNGRDGAWKIEQAVLAVMDGMYRFDKLKSEPPKQKRALKKVVFHVADRSEAARGRGCYRSGGGDRRGHHARQGSRQPARQHLHPDLSGRASARARQPPRLRGEDPRPGRHREARHERVPRGRARQPPAAEAHRHGVPRRRPRRAAGRPRRQGHHVRHGRPRHQVRLGHGGDEVRHVRRGERVRRAARGRAA